MRHAFLIATTVTLLHFSDYHSHALPFYSEEGSDRGGFARAIGYLGRHKQDGALVFSGGDMMNKGAPAWSDRYRCAEWKWLNGIVDAMAFGNHEADYGYADFARCRDASSFPVLSANTAGFPPSTVLETDGLRIGVFAVAGPDFPSLVRVPELRFGDPVAAARETVRALREDAKVDVVVLIGHEHGADDFELARAVPGIDLIFGTHSHLRQELTQIPGTKTWFISSGQYLTWISRVEMTFEEGALSQVRGRLIPVDSRMRANRTIAARLDAMQKDLVRDPSYRDLFVRQATLPAAMPADRLGQLAVDLMREAADADLAISTRSSFRKPLPPGPIDMETLQGALPYDNEIVVAELPGRRVRELLQYASTRDGDSASYTSGSADGERVRVATTDYLALVASGYRDFFAGATVTRTGVRVREQVRKHLAAGAAAP
ncbi:MAG TPA: bifunctional UDP-sugar hydrolase/5'-nucleotidase [Thermoanaerobaculia bacterium]|nr:bifunctional UDP-sugar hydrolase/5'-nucleotidase [Thermoanaerobaculia bacterium]